MQLDQENNNQQWNEAITAQRCAKLGERIQHRRVGSLEGCFPRERDEQVSGASNGGQDFTARLKSLSCLFPRPNLRVTTLSLMPLPF